MKTELTIKLNVEDCKKILNDLEKPVGNVSNLNQETYLLYNKLKGMVCGYSDLEEVTK